MNNNEKINYQLILDSHSNVKKYVDVPFRAGMFNLGWLPGGDKSITTLRETTLPAIRDAISLMDKDAILNIAVYPGHKEGDAEGQMILDYLAGISRHRVCVRGIVKLCRTAASFRECHGGHVRIARAHYCDVLCHIPYNSLNGE